jgi:hypothetical protein
MKYSSLQSTKLGLFHKRKTSYKSILGWFIGFSILIALLIYTINQLLDFGKVSTMIECVLDVNTPPDAKVEEMDPNDIQIHFEVMQYKGNDFCKHYLEGDILDQIELGGRMMTSCELVFEAESFTKFKLELSDI